MSVVAVPAGRADTDRGQVLMVRSAGRTARVAAARLAGELRRHRIAVSEVGGADVDTFGAVNGDVVRRTPVLAVIGVGHVGAEAVGLAVALDVALCPLDVTEPVPAWLLDPTVEPPVGDRRPVAQAGCDGARLTVTGPVTVAAARGTRLACSAFPGAVDSLEVVPDGPDRLRVLSAGGEKICSAIAVDSPAPMAVGLDDRALSCCHLAVRAHLRLLRWAGHRHPRA